MIENSVKKKKKKKPLSGKRSKIGNQEQNVTEVEGEVECLEHKRRANCIHSVLALKFTSM